MKSNQGEISLESCRTSAFQKGFTHCHCNQVSIQRPQIELIPYLTVKLFNNELPSIDSTSTHITLQRATSPEALPTISATAESTKSKRSIVSSTSLTFSHSKTEKQLTSSSSTSTAITTSLITTSSPSVPNMMTLLTSTLSPSVPNMTASFTSTSLTSTQSKPTKVLTKPESSTSLNLATAASTTSTSTDLTSVTSTVGKQSTTLSTRLASATFIPFITSKTTNQSMSSILLLTSSSRTIKTTMNRSISLRLSQLMFLLLMSISSVVSFPTQPAGTYGDNNVSVYVKQPTPLMTVKLSVLDQKVTETTAETKTDDHITHSRFEMDNDQQFSSEISVKLINLLGNPSTSNPIFDVSETDFSQFVTESSNETILLDLKPTSSVNLAVIPVLGIFFLMVILWMKCSTWFRDHLRDQDLDDDGKEYVILNPPEEGYREVEFRSDTSSMYYDTVSSYRSILRQKVEYGGFNNYDTVTSIRSILQQRADVRDAAVQVKLQGEHLKTDRWKSVSGILNNSGSSSDLLKVPKKTHRQVSFQTSQNESYDPPLQLTCDANIQVGDSSTERMKNKEQARLLQKPVDPNLGSSAEVSKYFGSGTQLSTESSNNSLIGLDIFGVPYPSTSHQEDNNATKQQETAGSDVASGGGGEHEGSAGETSSYGGASSVTSKDEPAQCEIINPKHRRVHQFQVLRVDSSDGLYRESFQSKDAELTSETTDVSEKDSTLPTETSQDDYSLAQPLPHTHHYLCRRLKQAKRRCKDSTGPIIDSISDFKPPIFSEVKFGQPPSDEDECDYVDDINLQVKHGTQRNSGLSQKLFIDENNETNCWCEQSMESGKGDKLNELLEAHASSVAAAPRASPISMHSSAASSTLSSHSSCSSLEAIKDEINEDGGEDGRNLKLAEDASCYIAQGMYAEEETPLIMDLAGDSPCQSPEIHALVRQRGHRSSSGYETQGHETPSTAKGHVPETGDTSCDVTPLTSSTNSLHECCDGKRCSILAEAQSTQHPLSTHLHQQPLPHPQHHLHHHHTHHHHHHHQQQQQQDQSAETLKTEPEVSQGTTRIPSYIPHNTFRQETRHDDDNNNNNNSLRRSVMERNQSLDQRLNLPSTSVTKNTNNSNSSSSNNSTIGGGGITGNSGNNNNNNNTSQNEILRIPDTGSDDLRSTAAGSDLLVKYEEPIDFKRFHRKPSPPILHEKEPLLLPTNYISPTTTSTADVHLPNTKTDSNLEIV